MGVIRFISPSEVFAPSEIFLELCPVGLGVLFSSVVPGCRFTPLTTGQSCQGCCFLAGGVLECNLADRMICGSVVHAI